MNQFQGAGTFRRECLSADVIFSFELVTLQLKQGLEIGRCDPRPFSQCQSIVHNEIDRLNRARR